MPHLLCLQPAAASYLAKYSEHFVSFQSFAHTLSCSAILGLLLAIPARGEGHGLAAPVQAQRGAGEPYIRPQLRLHIAPVLVGEQLGVVDKEDECWLAHGSLHTTKT